MLGVVSLDLDDALVLPVPILLVEVAALLLHVQRQLRDRRLAVALLARRLEPVAVRRLPPAEAAARRARSWFRHDDRRALRVLPLPLGHAVLVDAEVGALFVLVVGMRARAIFFTLWCTGFACRATIDLRKPGDGPDVGADRARSRAELEQTRGWHDPARAPALRRMANGADRRLRRRCRDVEDRSCSRIPRAPELLLSGRRPPELRLRMRSRPPTGGWLRCSRRVAGVALLRSG